MKVTIGQLTVTVDSFEELDELVKRYGGATVAAPLKRRIRKGEAIKEIQGALEGLNGVGVAQIRIAERVGVSVGTINRTLRKYPLLFIKGVDGMWRNNR